MLRTIRLTTALICFTLVTLLFLDFTGTLHVWFGWLAKVQFLPAVLALNLGVVLFLIALTWIFGRVYCSVICPLGIFQDIVSWLAGKRKKNRFRYSPALSWLRYGVMVNIYPCHDQRIRSMGGINRTLQRLRAHRLQLIRPLLGVGK